MIKLFLHHLKMLQAQDAEIFPSQPEPIETCWTRVRSLHFKGRCTPHTLTDLLWSVSDRWSLTSSAPGKQDKTMTGLLWLLNIFDGETIIYERLQLTQYWYWRLTKSSSSFSAWFCMIASHMLLLGYMYVAEVQHSYALVMHKWIWNCANVQKCFRCAAASMKAKALAMGWEHLYSVVTTTASRRRHNIFIATAANGIYSSQQPVKQSKTKKEENSQLILRWEQITEGKTHIHTWARLPSSDRPLLKRPLQSRRLTWMYFLCVSSLRTWATCLEKIFSRPVRAWMPTMVTPMGHGALPMAICR